MAAITLGAAAAGLVSREVALSRFWLALPRLSRVGLHAPRSDACLLSLGAALTGLVSLGVSSSQATLR